jgi:hypothetical protein
MIELIALMLSLTDDSGSGRLLERVFDRLLATVAHMLQVREGKVLSKDACLAQGLLSKWRQPSQSLANHRANALWRGEWIACAQAPLPILEPEIALLLERASELSDEEGVALAALEDELRKVW